MSDFEGAAGAIARLRARGGRLTTARRMVIEGLGQTREHVTADILARWIQHAHPEVHLSTVYRTLDSLAEWGIITQVRRPDGPSFFHLAPSHEHVVCAVCGRITDVPTAEFVELTSRLREHHGIELDVGHTALVGRCNAHSGG
jgi:Fur family transcriptional regulator, ferric uptake regulator